ncbi:hypothetical protein KO566_12425 [Flavobacteriaceae bacterium XHP0103]|uniref:hypothetical protein n=1 Tax=Marixanthotalea marina TaxID=2844359 RepID=UPI002989CE8E|nr:hypothetical protein [Marixanthotalea marina]MBU3822870.1 hypothetical protein [Marixanthotalea marina]
MKKGSLMFLLFISTLSCSKNDFSETSLELETDKATYQVNDEFKLTIKISSEVEKNIRFYKNMSNVDFLFLIKQDNDGFQQRLKTTFTEGSSLFGDNNDYIDEYIISPEKPFVKSFNGFIKESVDKIIFEIPELKISDSIDKILLLENPTITIWGNCETVYSNNEKSFPIKEIKILLD